MDQSPGLGSSLRLFAEQKKMHLEASTAGCRVRRGSLTRGALLHRAKPRDFLEVKEPKEVVLERGWGRTFLSQKKGGWRGRRAQIPVGDDGSRGRGSGRGQVKRSAAGEEKQGRRGRVRKMGINHRRR